MIEAFLKYTTNNHSAIKEWKRKTGKPVYGYFCCVSPEEILYAADVLPVRITGTGESLQQADLHVPPNTCPFARSCLDAGMRGDYDYLDGVIIPNTCDIVFSMQYFWNILVPRSKKSSRISGVDVKPFVHYLNYPEKITGRRVIPYYVEVLREFKQALERDLGREITEESLQRAIEVYNQDKTQMKRMYEMRKQDPPLISGYDAWTIANAGLMMPKDEHVLALKNYLDELESKGETAPGGMRIYISGSAMDWINAEIIKVVEESAVVVSDDLCVGTRSFWNPLDTTIDPLEAIARRSLATACPSTTVIDAIPDYRWAHMQDTIHDFNVDGAIFYVLKCCDGRLSEFPHLKDKLREELGLPVLYLEGDYTTEGVEQMRGRVEAFIEMIEG